MMCSTKLLPPHEGKEIRGLPPPHKENGGSGTLSPFPTLKTSEPDTVRTQKKLFILVVDDESQNRETVARVVARIGHSAEQAASGKEALEKHAAAEVKPDLVISDYNMVNMTGLELFRNLKETDPHVKMIIVSGGIDSDEKQTCLAEGVKTVILKPFSIGELTAAIERFGF
ncbi:MAG: response regulator [Candidatus ainarchaeum sp.]|nr:response regulator [Candidatus ainarchaeum sp.]